ncbi:hypothetical protein TREMEDRAFT_70382 [Tremella mesenterica DSM 1558]|uniref:uncharacterized protein n=1 Tax=Tremella mesenterica (strain ATCC 24925 / CBS 8224 / DSM 1558 / NBRC 9311 / NRRL Y-6157 / RJB 2259-6 / UBC 559-6) TaxID=578456 RepID=UPI00032D6555|nr:uncharacterized protein TREMEDRAFT_70382 [Tremella mesenterica DSM 1558]EIW65977.1 hypothetical protein TREMEDRAFT_70382 [Tremella mesenterica DSM 1558]
MGASDESFLPQIIGLFYATFDPRLGPVILHQVPENLITSSAKDDRSQSRSQSRTTSTSESHSHSHSRSRHRSPSIVQSLPSSHKPRDRTMLDFGPISEYVIPKKSLHGKLVSLLTVGWEDGEKTEFRVLGFPTALTDTEGRYTRNEYIWNLCFVFKAMASLDAYEPVVRKCARILRSAEIDSAYLSSPAADHTNLHAVLEQLFEDLNSYSETSIPLDGFNSLELKLFPFYPNPPVCEDWHVPIALVDLNALKDDNWDITAARVSEFIDGVNHVRKIAQLANADPALTRETIRHMLFYQVVMLVDIFQFSNSYTLKPSITHLAADETIIRECGPYSTLPSYTPPFWPVLLSLYSKLQSGLSVHRWAEENSVIQLGIDPRRFVSFGIIKGFLRRVHRWPLLVDREKATGSPLVGNESRRRVEFDKTTRPSSSTNLRDGKGESTFTLRSTESNASLGLGISPASLMPMSITGHGRTPPNALSPKRGMAMTSSTGGNLGRSMVSAETHSTGRRGIRSGALRVKEDRVDDEMLGYLDGRHHTDDIQVRFNVGWVQLEKILGLDGMIGGKGKKGVTIIYR